MNTQRTSGIIEAWPEQSREAAQLVIDQYGEPDEATPTQLVWHRPGPWKRIVATKSFYEHNFPAPHHDSVESFIDYRVPTGKVTALAEFDGSVIVERTVGEVSARCHDEQANFLALNLMHDIVTDAKSVRQARDYYAKEFADYRRGKPTPYMEGLKFASGDPGTADPDVRMLSDDDLKKAAEEGKRREYAGNGTSDDAGENSAGDGAGSDGAARTRIDVRKDDELHAWASRLDTTPEQIKEAVQAVGDRADKVELHLKGSRASTNAEQQARSRGRAP
jgi:hypothetical protein